MKNYEIIYFNEINSTNDFALANLEKLNDRQVIVANKQTSGRGKFSRSWLSSEKDNVYLSIVLKPSDKINPDLPLASITQYMSVVLCEILESYGIEAKIKWPNDILVNNKKIAGILTETSIQGDTLKGLVLGLGVNLNMSQEILAKIDQPATSLNLSINKHIDKNIFIENLLNSFFSKYDLFLKEGFYLIKQKYLAKSLYIGDGILLKTLKDTSKVILKDINNDGSLQIIMNGKEKIITAGEIII